jgi:hypothetical protein
MNRVFQIRYMRFFALIMLVMLVCACVPAAAQSDADVAKTVDQILADPALAR